ncbi:hypothetical protein [Microbacterium sp. C7(2022)]|uniref:hypothetical protein n=1 Tax=Microbacterium sp. C7(2022) TaxID=2992759 RepID=UPI00237BFBA7|nr:hypothetical protein [Microbacterium sp. C7(2022)]MDE0546972.1 hypothetical protein [Microbacterium sp. C7(2022)]
MQLGTRWTSGDEPPRTLPAALVEAVRSVDAALPGDQLGQPRQRWTLTWLEGRPIAELDSGIVVTVGPDGAAIVGHSDDEE